MECLWDKNIAVCYSCSTSEMLQEDIPNKLLDYTSVELAFQKVFYRHEGLQAWGDGDMELDNPGLKFLLGLVNYLASELQNLTGSLAKQKCSLGHCMLPWRNEWGKYPYPVLELGMTSKGSFSHAVLFLLLRLSLTVAEFWAGNFMEPRIYNMEVLSGNSLDFAIVHVNLELFFCVTCKNNKISCMHHQWIFFSCFTAQPLSWGICLLWFFCLVLLVNLSHLLQPPFQIINECWGAWVLAFQNYLLLWRSLINYAVFPL